jgi:hypothetical protein
MSDLEPNHNSRQYKQMLHLIATYREGRVSLQALVDNLDALRRALESPSRPWLEQFEHLWGMLEDVHAVMLDRTETKQSLSDQRIVTQALDNLVPLIQREMDAQDKGTDVSQ